MAFSGTTRTGMIPIDLSRKVALVTGVGADMGFAWYIAKALQAAGARLVFSTHPRLTRSVDNILERDQHADTRVLPFGAGMLQADKVRASDVALPARRTPGERARQ